MVSCAQGIGNCVHLSIHRRFQKYEYHDLGYFILFSWTQLENFVVNRVLRHNNTKISTDILNFSLPVCLTIRMKVSTIVPPLRIRLLLLRGEEIIFCRKETRSPLSMILLFVLCHSTLLPRFEFERRKNNTVFNSDKITTIK